VGGKIKSEAVNDQRKNFVTAYFKTYDW